LLFDTWQERFRQAMLMFALVLAIALPFILWDPKAIQWALGGVLLIVRPRMDSLGLSPVLFRMGLPTLPDWTGVATGFLVACFCAWKLPRSVASFCTGLGLAFILNFYLNKQAFGNYYLF